MNGAERMPRGAQIEELAVGRMHRDLTRPKWWATLWGRATIAAGGLAAVGVAVAAVVLLPAKPVDDATMVYCLEGPYRNADGSLPAIAVGVAAPDGVLPITDAVATCTRLWEGGGFERNDPLDPTLGEGAVPDSFTTCVTTEGMAAVVPGSIECSTLRLHPYHG